MSIDEAKKAMKAMKRNNPEKFCYIVGVCDGEYTAHSASDKEHADTAANAGLDVWDATVVGGGRFKGAVTERKYFRR